jgi:hypothetical protein
MRTNFNTTVQILPPIGLQPKWRIRCYSPGLHGSTPGQFTKSGLKYCILESIAHGDEGTPSDEVNSARIGPNTVNRLLLKTRAELRGLSLQNLGCARAAIPAL